MEQNLDNKLEAPIHGMDKKLEGDSQEKQKDKKLDEDSQEKQREGVFTYDKEQECIYYLVSQPEEDFADTIKMLQYNQIPGLLPVDCQYIDDQMQIAYDVKGKNTLRDRMGDGSVLAKHIFQLLVEVIQGILAGEPYFLEPEGYVLDPSYIYIGRQGKSVFLCYRTGWEGDFVQSFRSFLEYLMQHMRHDSREDTKVYYTLYEQYCQGELGLEELAEILRMHINEEERIVEETDAATGKVYTGEINAPIPSRTVVGKQHQRKGDKAITPEAKEQSMHIKAYCLVLQQKKKIALSFKKRYIPVQGVPCVPLLAGGSCTVGRSKGQGLHLILPEISRRHAVLEWDTSQVYITDLGSRNGTYRNGKKLMPHIKTRLATGDILAFADVVYALEATSATV